jgi:hypothetical protein
MFIYTVVIYTATSRTLATGSIVISWRNPQKRYNADSTLFLNSVIIDGERADF